MLPTPNAGWSEGVISHVAGLTPAGIWIVVGVVESQEAFDGFWPAGAGVRQMGGMPQQDVTPFQVCNNTFHHGQ